MQHYCSLGSSFPNYFFRAKIFFPFRNIFARKKYFCQQKQFFLQKHFFLSKHCFNLNVSAHLVHFLEKLILFKNVSAEILTDTQFYFRDIITILYAVSEVLLFSSHVNCYKSTNNDITGPKEQLTQPTAGLQETDSLTQLVRYDKYATWAYSTILHVLVYVIEHTKCLFLWLNNVLVRVMTSMLVQHTALGHVLAFVIVHLNVPLLMALYMTKKTKQIRAS